MYRSFMNCIAIFITLQCLLLWPCMFLPNVNYASSENNTSFCTLFLSSTEPVVKFWQHFGWEEFFHDSYFAEVLQMNMVCSRQNRSRVHNLLYTKQHTTRRASQVPMQIKKTCGQLVLPNQTCVSLCLGNWLKIHSADSYNRPTNFVIW